MDQIDASNFEDLEVAWIWRADNFGPTVDYAFKSTPSFIDGMMTYMHDGNQHIVVQTGGRTPGALVALRLP